MACVAAFHGDWQGKPMGVQQTGGHRGLYANDAHALTLKRIMSDMLFETSLQVLAAIEEVVLGWRALPHYPEVGKANPWGCGRLVDIEV